MPGLVGIISNTPREVIERDLSIMVNCMMHEPFYTSGILNFDSMMLGVGWVNHEKCFSDCTQVWNETKDVCFIFSGEDFTERGEIGLLKGRGHDCNIEKANYLVHLYEEKGLKCIEKLNGWFAGVIIDLKLRKVFLFNDRYGMHRIFYHEHKNGFYFSSEAKALLAAIPETREFDPKGLGEFLTCGCTLGSHSLYKNISILPLASLLTFENGEVEKKSYFDVGEWSGQGRLDEKEVSDNIVDLFGEIVKRYTGGYSPVGVSLTGGLDSRMIMASLSTGDGEFPCYTFGSMYRNTFDVKTAREVSEACGQTHQTLILGEEFLKYFQTYLEKAVYISDGYLGLSGAAELYVNSLAREISPVQLSGNCGGELLRCARAFKPEFPRNAFVKPELQTFLRDAQTTFKELETVDALTFALFNLAPSQGYGRLTIQRSQVNHRTPFMDNDLVKLVYQAPSNLLKGLKLTVAIISRYNPNLLEIPTDRGFLCNSSWLKSMIRQHYRKSLIKAEYLSSHGMPNWLATISHLGLSGILEKSFIGRDKFQHFRLWTQKYLADYIADVLIAGSREMGEFFNLRQVEKMVHEHVTGKQNYINEIDKLLTLTLTKKLFIKRNASVT